MKVQVEAKKVRSVYHFKKITAHDEAGNVLATDGKPLFQVIDGVPTRTPRPGAEPKYVGVNVINAKPRWHVTPETLAAGTREGWLDLKGDVLTVKAANGTLTYKVHADPGYYCCHCDAKLSSGGELAQNHVKHEHGGEKSPDPQNPSGYKRTHYYACTLEQ